MSATALPRFLGLSTGRAGSRYFAGLMNKAGVKTLHEQQADLKHWSGDGAIGEVSAWFVSQLDDAPDTTQIWHFSRHPQPCVASNMAFGFWDRRNKSMHPFLRKTGDRIVDSFLFWVDWNKRILAVPSSRRRTFQIEAVTRELIEELSHSVGIECNAEKVDPCWNEKQVFTAIPEEVESEVFEMMGVLGYA